MKMVYIVYILLTKKINDKIFYSQKNNFVFFTYDDDQAWPRLLDLTRLGFLDSKVPKMLWHLMAEGYHLKAGVFWVKYGTRNKGAVKKEKNIVSLNGVFLIRNCYQKSGFSLLKWVFSSLGRCRRQSTWDLEWYISQMLL